MTQISDKLLCYKVAKSYYMEGFLQKEISQRLGISTAQVSRCLKKCREYGIVEINVKFPNEESDEDLKGKFLEITGIKDVIISSTCEEPDINESKSLDGVAYNAADYLAKIMDQAKNIGIGWGESVYRTALVMDYANQPTNACLIPLIGNAGNNQPCYQINTIVDRMAEKSKAQRFFINAPAFFQDSFIKQSTVKSDNIHLILKLWSKLDVAVFGLAAPWKLIGRALQKEFGIELNKKLILENNTGSILSYFFDENGKLEIDELEEHFLSISHQQLKQIENKVCIACGKEKAKGIYAACRLGMIDTLITDRKTVECIVDKEG